MVSIKLKPCYNCGGQAVVRNEPFGRFSVICKSCKRKTYDKDSKEDAVVAWKIAWGRKLKMRFDSLENRLLALERKLEKSEVVEE